MEYIQWLIEWLKVLISKSHISSQKKESGKRRKDDGNLSKKSKDKKVCFLTGASIVNKL